MNPDILNDLKKLNLTDDIIQILSSARSLTAPESLDELNELALGGQGADTFEVSYDVPSKGKVVEARVNRCRNGIAVNYTEAYMRRRDPSSMVVADELPSDKRKFSERFDISFDQFQGDVFEWFKDKDLVVLPFYSGNNQLNLGSLLIAPLNASFFAACLAQIQGMVPLSQITSDFNIRSVIYLAPTFRHSMCEGKQVVVHNRRKEFHEIYSLNLYPGPSAKKGIYSVLLDFGEKDDWTTIHGSTILVTTPYDNEFVIMHEGASGGGKSEMLQYPHREPDGRLLIGQNILSGKKRYIPLFQGCALNPVTDDMALSYPSIQNDSGRLVVQDAEKGWFVRVNHITHYGVDRYLEELCTSPEHKLAFLNLHSVPNATCLIWEHEEDQPGKPCPNPRVIIPRNIVRGIVNEPVEVNVRSFGVRTPPCTRKKPTYGIIGMLHILPPALAWLWRLVSPRGHDNPSITETSGMSSEGVGSYWPFATGRKVDQANILLKQIVNTPRTRYTLTPNQYIGSWNVGFMPQWIAREYLSRRGSARFKSDQLEPARCPLLGQSIHSMQIEGFFINREFLQVNTQKEVGREAYDAGAAILTEFFKRELTSYLKETDLDPLGRKIIEYCMNDAGLPEYEQCILEKI